MTEIVGHDWVIKILEKGIPRVSIFQGENSVGKYTTSQWVREDLQLVDGDYLEVKHLDADRARAVGRFLNRTPFGHTRLAVISLHAASDVAQNVLLRTLEDMPDTSKVILLAAPGTLGETIRSRGTLFTFLNLSVEDVKKILMARNFGEASAEQLAILSGGHVGTALRYASANDTKIAVLGAVRCLRDRDSKGLDTFATRWSEEHTSLLTTLCQEAITGRNVIFEKEHAEALGKRTALKVLSATRADVRPRLVIHAQLMGVLRGE